jgi:hypothetical protein
MAGIYCPSIFLVVRSFHGKFCKKFLMRVRFKSNYKHVKFEVLTAVKVSMLFWVETPCRFVWTNADVFTAMKAPNLRSVG